MRHTIEMCDGALCKDGLVEYAWRFERQLHRMGGLAVGDPLPAQPGSEEEFITDQSWGDTHLGPRLTGEYRVKHPTWRIWPVSQPYLLADIEGLYGQAFEPFLRRRPRSAFLAEGSPVAVYAGAKIRQAETKGKR